MAWPLRRVGAMQRICESEEGTFRAFVMLRYALIAATAYLLIVEEGFGLPPLGALLPVVVALASNVVVAGLPEVRVRAPSFAAALILGDTAWITIALLASGRFHGEFFYLYFFILLLAAVGESLPLIVLGAFTACGAYLYILTASGDWSMWNSPSLIRIPFLATAAFFYGYLVDRTRHERRRADARTAELRDEAEISSALVCVGHAMISSIDGPVVLERLCQVAAEVLDCDYSTTLVWESAEVVFVPRAWHGGTPEEIEALRLVHIPRRAITAFVEQLAVEKVAEVRGSSLSAIAAHEGKSLCIALERASDVIGILIAGRRHSTQGFTVVQRRICRGIAQTASMALANARLFGELEKASRVKSDFVATMSHELRTPLNQIIGYTDLLLEDTFGPLAAEQRDVLGRVSRSSGDLLALILTILDLTRLEARDVPLAIEPVVPAELLGELDQDTRHLQERAALRLEWQVDPTTPVLHTDRMKLKIVLRNLLTNAVKFTEQGEVVVAVRGLGDGVEFRVSDTGVGIRAEDQASVFEPFVQIYNGDSHRHAGVGLGLHIVRRVVDLLGGSIGLESEQGRGSTFRVRLPLS